MSTASWKLRKRCKELSISPAQPFLLDNTAQKISKLFSKKFVNNRKETLSHNLVQKTIVQGFHEVRLTNYRSY